MENCVMTGDSFWTIQVDVSLIAAVLLCLLPMVWTGLVIRRTSKQRRERSKSPFGELKRPAGEAARLKVISLDDKTNETLSLLVGMPAVSVLVILLTKPHSLVAALIWLSASAIWAVIFTRKLLRVLDERQKYQLGFDGERYVGEELSQLIAFGFQIYHDVPFDGFNVDHVLIGRPGIFVVETKTRRKPISKDGDKKYQVIFDGRSLQWPWGADEDAIRQIIGTADTFQKWLSKAVGCDLPVSAILTIPGWWVELGAPSRNLFVLNPKQIVNVCASSRQKFDEKVVQQICYQLDQKCRIEIN